MQKNFCVPLNIAQALEPKQLSDCVTTVMEITLANPKSFDVFKYMDWTASHFFKVK